MTERNRALDFVAWIMLSEWQMSRDKLNHWDLRKGRLLFGVIEKTVTTQQLYDIYELDNTHTQPETKTIK